MNVVCTKRTATTVLPYTGQWPPGREYSKRHVALLDVQWCYWPTNVFFFIRFPLMLDFFFLKCIALSDRVQSDEATVSSVLVEVNGRMDSYMKKKILLFLRYHDI